MRLLESGDFTDIYPPGTYKVEYKYKSSSYSYTVTIVTEDYCTKVEMITFLRTTYEGVSNITGIDGPESMHYYDYKRMLKKQEAEKVLKQSKRIFK